MKLTNIETYVIKTGEPNLGGLFWFFIKLETDEGIVGWGETAVLYTLPVSYTHLTLPTSDLV